MANKGCQTIYYNTVSGSENERFWITKRSPRWSSGYPRILLALVLEFDSHRDEILDLLAKMQTKKLSAVESALQRGQAQFDASRQGRKCLILPRDKIRLVT